MVAYTSDKCKNVCVAGHGTTGKTTLVEAMMFSMGVTNRMGAVENGNTISDFTEEETNRGISISTSVCSAEYKNQLISVLDTPGYFDFAGEMYSAIPFSESVLLTLKASNGLDVGTEKAFTLAKKFKRSTAIVVNEIDRDNINIDEVVSNIESDLGVFVAPISYPANVGQDVDSIIDVLNSKLIKYSDGKRSGEDDLSGEYAEKAVELREKLMETVAESEEALMEKYLEEGELTAEELKDGLAKAFTNGDVLPIFFCAPNKGVGVDCINDAITDFFPSPDQKPLQFGEGELEMVENEKVKACVFKVNSIPQFGEVYIFKVLHGVIEEGTDLFNVNSSNNEKFGQMFTLRGKERTSLSKAVAGQIAATVKLKFTKTGDQIVQDKSTEPIEYKLIQWPEAIVRGAFTGASKEDTDKVATALKKIQIEDASFKMHSDPELKQLFVDGLGELHLEVIAKKIKNQFGIDVRIEEPRIPYRETIKGRAEVRYRHKKQSGGAGEFAEVNIVIEPNPEEEFEFVDAIVGGVISNRFIPAVEKGIKEVMVEGVVAGCKFINCRVTLNDGKEHPVDSKEVAFKKAASVAFKDAVLKANPILLEPIYDVEITVPEEYAGTVMGDISSRRGKPQGMESEGKYSIVKAQVPLKELHGYSTQLRSFTNGRGTYSIAFSHYDPVPGDIQKKIMDEYKKSKEQ